MRSVRARADDIGIDYSHFTGQRRWTDEALRRAVAGATSWTGVARGLGLRGGGVVSNLKGHVNRLGLDVAHFQPEAQSLIDSELAPTTDRLDRAGTFIAAAWFSLCGQDVSWPLEPCRYDLIVCSEGGLRKVQVKTTTFRSGRTWTVSLTSSSRTRPTYEPGEIDDFFVVDGELRCYLIPYAAVGGLHAIRLNAYERYRVADMATASLGASHAETPQAGASVTLSARADSAGDGIDALRERGNAASSVTHEG